LHLKQITTNLRIPITHVSVYPALISEEKNTRKVGLRWGQDIVPIEVLVGKPEGKRPLGRPRRRWVDNIRMDLGEVGME
jgi:hypothetical protein